jgi:hypothetical protein
MCLNKELYTQKNAVGDHETVLTMKHNCRDSSCISSIQQGIQRVDLGEYSPHTGITRLTHQRLLV